MRELFFFLRFKRHVQKTLACTWKGKRRLCEQIHLFKKHVLSPYSVPGTVRRKTKEAVNKTGECLHSLGSSSSGGGKERTRKKHVGSLMTRDDSMKEEDSKWPGVPYTRSPGKVLEMRMHEEGRERLSCSRTRTVLAEGASGKALSWSHVCQPEEGVLGV